MGEATYHREAPELFDRNRGRAAPILTHVDVFPQYEVDCLALLDTMSIDTSQDDGNIGYEVLPEADHPNHFTVIEEWTTRKSRDADLMAAHTRAFRESLPPMEGALYDARLYNELH
jgi:quinol monooxygenase YgiN